jgi:hypothetical protein
MRSNEIKIIIERFNFYFVLSLKIFSELGKIRVKVCYNFFKSWKYSFLQECDLCEVSTVQFFWIWIKLILIKVMKNYSNMF